MNIKPKDLNLGTIAKRFSDEGEAYRFLESIRWPDGQVCPHCGSIGHAYFLNPKGGARITRTGKTSARRVWKCGDCRKQFSVLIGTIFEGSHIPLFKWLLAFHMLASAKNGIAAYELHRTLHISGESAWFMAHRIRYALEGEATNEKLTGTVEADETFIGGLAKNMHKADREREIQGRGPAGKTPVVSLVERGGSEFASHETVNHMAGEYVRGNAYTITAEGISRSSSGRYTELTVTFPSVICPATWGSLTTPTTLVRWRTGSE